MAKSNPQQEAFLKALGLAGGPTAMAEALGEKTASVCSNWIERGVPPNKAWPICQIPQVRGKVRPEELRPDIFGGRAA